MLGLAAGGNCVVALAVDVGAADVADGVAETLRGGRELRSFVDVASLRRLLEGGFVGRGAAGTLEVDVQRRPWTSWVTVGPRFQDSTSSTLPGTPSGPGEIAPMIWSAGWSAHVSSILWPHGSIAVTPSAATSGHGAPG
jgi:hypothetical protein